MASSPATKNVVAENHLIAIKARSLLIDHYKPLAPTGGFTFF